METRQPNGLLTTAPVVNGDLSEQFGTHFDWLGIGGWRAVDSLAARDAIPVTERLESSYSSGRRRRWMRVFVWADTVRQEYELAISDADWNAASTDQAKIALLADNTRWVAVQGGGARQWVAGPQRDGTLVYDQGYLYRVRRDIANSQTAPANNPANYLLIGPGAGSPAPGQSNNATWTADTLTSVTAVLGPGMPLDVEEYCILLIPIDATPEEITQIFNQAFSPAFV